MTLGETPSREKVRRGTWILGLLAVGALVVFFTDELRRELAEGPTMWVVAEQTRGLAAGAPVWLAGHRVGRVARVDLRSPETAPERRVLVKAVIREDQADRIRADASAILEPPGLMEPTVLSIRPGSPGASPYDFSDTLEARRSVTAAELRARAERARSALDSLRRAEERVLALADTGSGTVARIRADGDLRRRLGRVGARLGRLTAAARDDRPGLVRFLRRPEAARRLRASLRDADSLSARLGRVAGRWTGLAGRLASLRDRIDRLREQLDGARGSAGRLLHDDALRRELEELRRRIPAARSELLADPFRWLRFELF